MPASALALAAQESGERNLGKEQRSRRADLRVGRDQVVLSLANIGAAFEQRRRQARREFGRCM